MAIAALPPAAAFGALLLSVAAAARDLPDDAAARKDAVCIDAYNLSKAPFDAGGRTVGKNPILVRFLAEGTASTAAGGSASGRADADAVWHVFPDSGDTVTGIATGLSFEGTRYRVHRDWGFDLQLRLGIARRVYGIGHSFGSGGCRPHRIDVVFDLLQWDAGGIERHFAGGSEMAFASVIAFPAASLGYYYPAWSWKAKWSLLAFHVAPRFNVGTAVAYEYLLEGFILAARVGAFLPPGGELTFTLGLGYGLN